MLSVSLNKTFPSFPSTNSTHCTHCHQPKGPFVWFKKKKLTVLFNDALNTVLINSYIGNILIGKIPTGYVTVIDHRSTACQTGVYTIRLTPKDLTQTTDSILN